MIPFNHSMIDFAMAFPSREGLLSTMHERNIVGKMWHALQHRFNIVKIRVLHPKIRQSSEVEFLRVLPEGSRLSTSIFGIVMADLIHELQCRFPQATITHNGNSIWIGGILPVYVNNLCLIFTNANELQNMIHRVPDVEQKSQDANQRRQVEDYGIPRNSPAEERS